MKKKTKLLIALLLVFVGVGLTYAVYTTSVGGNANVTAANWLIKVKTGSDFDNQAGIDVSNGATNINLGSCQKLSPGGSCTLPFRVDATQTEVDTILIVELGDNIEGATLEELTNAGINLRISDGVNEDYAYLLNMGTYKDLNLVINWEAGDEEDDTKAGYDVNIANKLSSITIPVNMIVKQRTGGLRTVTFNTHDSNIQTPESVQVSDGDSILEANIPVLVKNGYIFLGWFTSENGGVQLTSSTPIIDNIEYHARFREAISYTVTFDSNGGSSVLPIQVVEGSTLSSIPTSENGAKQLTGWFDSNDNELTLETVINSNITYTARWRLIIPVVSESTLGVNAYDGDLTTYVSVVRDSWRYLKLPNGVEDYKINIVFRAAKSTGTGFGIAFFDENKQVIEPKYEYTSSGGSDSGYTALGQLLTTQQTTTLLVPPSASYVGVMKVDCSNDVYVYDMYLTEKEYVTVTFNTHDENVIAPQSIQVREGNSISSIPTVSKTGYAFDGWYTEEIGGTKLTSSTIIMDDIEYHARFIEEVTITFNADGGSAVSPIKIGKGSTLGELPTTSKNGYYFDGWYDSNSNKLTTSTVINNDITYTAHYLEEVTVTFNSNGGNSVSPVQVVEGSTLQEIPQTTKNDERFVGWFDSNDNKLTLETVINSNITYTAKWGIDIPVVSESTLGQDAYDGDLTTYASMVRDSWRYLKLPNDIEGYKLNLVFRAAKNTGTGFGIAFFDENNQVIEPKYAYTSTGNPDSNYTVLGQLLTTQQETILAIPSNTAYVGVMKIDCRNDVYVYDIFLTD